MEAKQRETAGFSKRSRSSRSGLETAASRNWRRARSPLPAAARARSLHSALWSIIIRIVANRDHRVAGGLENGRFPAKDKYVYIIYI